MSFRDYCIDWFIEHLERDIEAHESGRIWDIGASEVDMPEWYLIEDEDARRPLSLAFDFWDSWIDDRNHGWCIYEPMTREQWPLIARHIVRGLREGWSWQQLMDNAYFNPPPLPPPRRSWWRRVFNGG